MYIETHISEAMNLYSQLEICKIYDEDGKPFSHPRNRPVGFIVKIHYPVVPSDNITIDFKPISGLQLKKIFGVFKRNDIEEIPYNGAKYKLYTFTKRNEKGKTIFYYYDTRSVDAGFDGDDYILTYDPYEENDTAEVITMNTFLLTEFQYAITHLSEDRNRSDLDRKIYSILESFAAKCGEAPILKFDDLIRKNKWGSLYKELINQFEDDKEYIASVFRHEVLKDKNVYLIA